MPGALLKNQIEFQHRSETIFKRNLSNAVAIAFIGTVMISTYAMPGAGRVVRWC